MNSFRRHAILGLAVTLAMTTALRAQQKQARAFSVGYVYPAGARQGATSEHVIAGQLLSSPTNVYVSGGGVQATITEIIRPISGKELNDLRILADELLARKAAVRNDFKTLERFRSFKNAKDAKSTTMDDKEIAEIKKKYAGATWTAEDENHFNEVRKKLNSNTRRPANPAICELVICRFTVAPDAKPGQRELRLVTAAGLSNPLVFWIGRLPEFSEEASKDISEQRSAIAGTANAPKSRKTPDEMTVTLPAVVNGQILPGDVDRFRFAARKGQRLVAAVNARQLIPYLADAVPGWFQATLALCDAKGKEVAYDDDYRFNPDPVLYYEIPEDGEYAIEIKDSIFRGREDFVYRITLGELPFVTSMFPLGGSTGAQTAVELKGWNLPVSTLTLDNKNSSPGVRPVSATKEEHVSNHQPFAVDALPERPEQERNSQRRTAQAVTPPIIINGLIDHPDDRDYFKFEGRAGDQIVAEVYARRLNSPLDSALKLTDSTGKQLAFNDDHEDKACGLNTHHADSRLNFTLPENGTFYIQVSDAQHKGGEEYAYRLRISAPMPDFELRIVPSAINARAGATAPITVYALRKDGFTNEIALALKDAPSGFKLSGGRIPATQDQMRVTLTVPPTLLKEPVNLAVEGSATIQGQAVVRPAVPSEDMMQAFAYRHLVPARELKVTVSGRYTPKASVKIVGETPVKITAGGTGRVRIEGPQAMSSDKVKLELSDAPDGIAIQSVSFSGAAAEIILKSDTAKVKPGQKGNLIVNAFAAKSPPSEKGKPRDNKKRAPLSTLPAIPFEIVNP